MFSPDSGLLSGLLSLMRSPLPYGLRLGCVTALLLAAAPAAEPVFFRTDVMQVLSKAGCNLGGCHGNGGGKGGFKLSLRGQDAELDWQAIAREQGGRRVNLLEPETSLLLLKATGSVAHEGGKRFGPDSPEYATLLGWLRSGGDDNRNAPTLKKLTVTPREQILIEPATTVALHAVATFSDGSGRDVTRFAVYEPNNQTVKVSPEGLASREKAGESTVLVRFLNQQIPVHLAFVPARPDFVWRAQPAENFIDEAIFAKLKTLRMNPSEACSDDVFLRRAHLDLLGLVPTAEEARAFAGDTAPDKRARLVETLLERAEFADFWALKWADLLRVEQRQLDATGVTGFHDWIRDSIRDNKPLDQFAREIVAARGSTFANPPANWWRANRDPVTRGENTARVFLGTQLNCAQCHNHPFERWTQDDYYNWAGVFARVDYQMPENKKGDKFDKSEFKGDQSIVLKASGSVMNPRTNEKAKPHFLGGPAPKTDKEHDELLALADWLAQSPMFARTQVNRVWANLLGRGLVEPVDDFRASNPPSHPALLEALAKDFASHGYDLRRLIRTIMATRTYQLSAVPNATNAEDESNFAHGVVRRLTAEQLLDSVSAVLAVPLKIEGQPEGIRLAQVPGGRQFYAPKKTDMDRFAATFGKPPRLIASECERSNDIALPQVFQWVSGPVFQQMLTKANNRLGQLVESAEPPEKQVDELYWTVLSRGPSPEEAKAYAGYLEGKKDDVRAALEDVVWALLNSKEFLFRR
jgi:mono/diheme cytochrome c family protein